MRRPYCCQAAGQSWWMRAAFLPRLRWILQTTRSQALTSARGSSARRFAPSASSGWRRSWSPTEIPTTLAARRASCVNSHRAPSGKVCRCRPIRECGRWPRLASAAGSIWRTLRVDDEERSGGVSIRVLHPPAPEWERQRVRNEDSVVLEIHVGEVSVILPGDIGREGERAIRPLLSKRSAVVVLKAPASRQRDVEHPGTARPSAPGGRCLQRRPGQPVRASASGGGRRATARSVRGCSRPPWTARSSWTPMAAARDSGRGPADRKA